MTEAAPAQPDPYRIVIGIDFDVTGEAALREALRLSTHRDNVALHVVHVLADRSGPVRNAEGIATLSRQLEEAPRILRDHLVAVSSSMPFTGATSIRLHVRLGEPAAAIHQLAVDVNADLIVVGTHGRKGLARLTLGSTSDHLVKNAHCPVLVARPRQYEGLKVTETPAPACAACDKVRADTHGAQTLCAEHQAASLRFHPYESSEVFSFGAHNPGSIV